jgi:hypothetical protein
MFKKLIVAGLIALGLTTVSHNALASVPFPTCGNCKKG